MKKQCSKCKDIKILSEFYKCKSTNYRPSNKCKRCFKVYNAKSYVNNKEMVKTRNTKWRVNNMEKVKIYNIKHRTEKKNIVINHYTKGKNTCMWIEGCILSDPDTLAIDHINNDGAEHRKLVGGGNNMINWLIKNNFPEGFQILCGGHNIKKDLLRRRGKELPKKKDHI